MNEKSKTNISKPTISIGTYLFEALLWVLLIFPGIIFIIKKNNAKKHLNKLKEQINDNYVNISNILNNQIEILINIYCLLGKEDNFAKLSFSEILKETNLTKKGQLIDTATNKINNLIKELKNDNIFDEIERNKNLEKEIFSIKDTYNNAVLQWNKEIFLWPTNKIVAAKEGYTTIETYDVFPKIKVNGKQGLLK